MEFRPLAQRAWQAASRRTGLGICYPSPVRGRERHRWQLLEHVGHVRGRTLLAASLCSPPDV